MLLGFGPFKLECHQQVLKVVFLNFSFPIAYRHYTKKQILFSWLWNLKNQEKSTSVGVIWNVLLLFKMILNVLNFFLKICIIVSLTEHLYILSGSYLNMAYGNQDCVRSSRNNLELKQAFYKATNVYTVLYLLS